MNTKLEILYEYNPVHHAPTLLALLKSTYWTHDEFKMSVR